MVIACRSGSAATRVAGELSDKSDLGDDQPVTFVSYVTRE